MTGDVMHVNLNQSSQNFKQQAILIKIEIEVMIFAWAIHFISLNQINILFFLGELMLHS